MKINKKSFREIEKDISTNWVEKPIKKFISEFRSGSKRIVLSRFHQHLIKH